jgi:diphthamide biosynthesis protein 3
MSVYHDEIEIEDFEYDEEEKTYYYPCPCGDRFQITKVLPFSILAVLDLVASYKNLIILTPLQEELKAGEEVATCPSCSLIVKVIYDPVSSCHVQCTLMRFVEVDYII